MHAATAGVQGLGPIGAGGGVRVQSAKRVGPLNMLHTVEKAHVGVQMESRFLIKEKHLGLKKSRSIHMK